MVASVSSTVRPRAQGESKISYWMAIGSASLLLASAPSGALQGAEAVRCRAAAEALRDRAYDEMRLLIVRVERSPNLSLQALTDVETEILRREAEILKLETQAGKFAFAAEPAPGMRSAHKDIPPGELEPRVASCLERLPTPAATSQ